MGTLLSPLLSDSTGRVLGSICGLFKGSQHFCIIERRFLLHQEHITSLSSRSVFFDFIPDLLNRYLRKTIGHVGALQSSLHVKPSSIRLKFL